MALTSRDSPSNSAGGRGWVPSNVVPIDRRTKPSRGARLNLRDDGARSSSGGRPCKVCRAHDTANRDADQLRSLVDTWFSRGQSCAEIHRRVVAFCEGWPTREIPPVDSIERHTLRHTMDSVRLARDIAAERMRQFGETETHLMEQFLEPLADTSFAMAMVARDKVALGEIEPRNVADVVRILEAWARFRPTAESEGIPKAEHDADIAGVIEQARRVMTTEQYDDFVASLRAAGRDAVPREHADPDEQ